MTLVCYYRPVHGVTGTSAIPRDTTHGRTSTAGGECAVEGCGRPHFGRGWCRTHYFRVRRTGDVGTAEVATKRPEAECAVDGCDRTIRGGARGWCHTHYTRYRRQGDPNVVGTPRPPRGPDNIMWAGDEASYSAVHQRLRRERGPAAAHPCVACGGTAEQWAYDHSEPEPRRDPSHDAPYSVDLARYQPMCQSCHKRLDHAQRQHPHSCSVPECSGAGPYRKGLCNAHYLRARRALQR